MRFHQTLVLSLMFVALLGTVFVALIIKSTGPAEIVQELTPSQFASKPIVVLHKAENEELNTLSEVGAQVETVGHVKTRRTLPDNYMNTLELYRNRLRISQGEDVKRLTAHDFREGYGLYKIPTKMELKKMLGRGVDKN